MFGRVDFREDENKMRENEEIKLFEECLVGREREENDNGTHMFSLQTHQKVLTKMCFFFFFSWAGFIHHIALFFFCVF